MTSVVLLAVVASVAYGVSDVVGGAVVRRHATAALALWAQSTGLAVLLVAGAVVRPTLSPGAVGWGLGAGAVGALAVLAFYTALQRGRTAVVAPLAGTGVVVPVVAGLAQGEQLGVRSGLGLLAVVAGVLVAVATFGDDAPVNPPGRSVLMPVRDGCVPDVEGRGRGAAGLAVLSAAGFGGFFLLVDQATSQSRTDGLRTALVVALAVQVGALVVTALVATRHTRACLLAGRSLLVPATAVGLLDVGADLALTVAIDEGPLSVVGPLGSLDPVVSVLLAIVVARERLGALQAVGVVLALTGTVLVATG